MLVSWFSKFTEALINFITDLELSDVKNASTTHRKIVMKGCNKPWLTAIRQILMSLETAHVEDPITVASVDPIPFDVLPTNE